MADITTITLEALREPVNHLSSASLHSCYIETLHKVIEGILEDIPDLVNKYPADLAKGYILDKAATGLNLLYLAQDQLGRLKTDIDGSEDKLHQVRLAAQPRAAV
jgi:hypothetical protein